MTLYLWLTLWCGLTHRERQTLRQIYLCIISCTRMPVIIVYECFQAWTQRMMTEIRMVLKRYNRSSIKQQKKITAKTKLSNSWLAADMFWRTPKKSTYCILNSCLWINSGGFNVLFCADENTTVLYLWLNQWDVEAKEDFHFRTPIDNTWALSLI